MFDETGGSERRQLELAQRALKQQTAIIADLERRLLLAEKAARRMSGEAGPNTIAKYN